MRRKPTFERNGYTVDRNEIVKVKMGLLDDLMHLLMEIDPGWNSITTPDSVVELCRIIMKPDTNEGFVHDTPLTTVQEMVENLKRKE